MKGCLIINKKSLRFAAITVFVLLVVFATLGTVAIVATSQCGNVGADSSESEFTFPEVISVGSDGFSARKQVSASILATTGIVFESGKLEQTVNLSNPDENSCAYVISLYLGDGTMLFQTEPVYPGDTVNIVSLSRELSCGHYSDAIIVYDCYSVDGAMNPLTRCELVIEITSQ